MFVRLFYQVDSSEECQERLSHDVVENDFEFRKQFRVIVRFFDRMIEVEFLPSNKARHESRIQSPHLNPSRRS